MFEFDIPEDAKPAQVYGTVEFERARLSRVPLPIRRAVAEPVEQITAQEARLRALAASRRIHGLPKAPRVYIAKVIKYRYEFGPYRPRNWMHIGVQEPEPQPEQDEDFDRHVPCREIIRATAVYYNVTSADIRSHRRTANVVFPRQVAMYLCRMLTLRSLPDIGRRIGGRDHTTVLHGVNKIDALIKNGDSGLIESVEAIKKMLPL
jgi:hypothetical protein